MSDTSPALKLDDIYSHGLLASLLGGNVYLPFTSSSMRPYCLVHILNDVLLNRRARILEFGSGVSTRLLGRLIRKNQLGARVTSVEHDPAWAKLLADGLRQDDTNEHVEVLTAPLTGCALAKDDNLWYDVGVLDRALRGRTFDLVIVDGPPAWEPGRERARYPALPYIRSQLAKSFSFYLDDSEREGERMISDEWASELGARFIIAGSTLACCRVGEFFNSEPVKG